MSDTAVLATVSDSSGRCDRVASKGLAGALKDSFGPLVVRLRNHPPIDLLVRKSPIPGVAPIAKWPSAGSDDFPVAQHEQGPFYFTVFSCMFDNRFREVTGPRSRLDFWQL